MNWIRNLAGCGLAAMLLGACALPGAAAPSPTVDANSIVTAAAATAYVRLTEAEAQVTPSPEATSTETPVPAATAFVLPTSIPTIEPIPGVMRANANVRGVPAKSKAHDIGGLLLGQNVKVIGRNDAATWFYILYADSPTGTGWVTYNAITLSGDMGLLPILIYPNGQEADPIMIPPFIFRVTGTPQPPAPPPADWSKYGVLNQPANVRIGPSVGFLAMGVLDPGTTVTFRGRLAENAWVQIDYPSGPDGHGWILSSLVDPHDGFGGLPYYDVLGTPVTAQADQPAATVDPNLPVLPSETPTPEPPTVPAPPGAEAQVTTQINVRSGPAQGYSPLGMLNPKDKVTILGLTINKLWYRIEYPAGSGSFGWVASQYLSVTGDMRSLPYFNDQGTPAP